MAVEIPRARLGALWLLVLGTLLPAAVGALEIEVASEHVSGRFAAHRSSEVSELSVALTAGEQLRFRIEVPYLEVTVPGTLVLGSLGLSPRQLQSVSPERLAALIERAERSRSGPGDVRLALAARIAGGGARLYRLDAEIELKAPTADAEEFLGTGEWDARLGLDAQRRSWSATLFGGVGWNRLGGSAELELNDVVDGYFGLESEPLGGRVRLSGWIEGSGAVTDEADGRLAVGVGLVGGGRARWRGGVTVGLTDASEEVGVQLGVSFNAAPDRRRRP